VRRKLPIESFDFYVGLGVGRSYSAVAAHYGVSKVAVTNLATKEAWQKRLADLETKARRASEEKNLETLEEVHARHRRIARAIQAKALEALTHWSLDNAMDAVRALELGVRQERLLIGEPTDRNAISIEETIRKEYERVMRPAGEADWPDPPASTGAASGSAA